ncbi:MAG: hypothetical protein PHY02_07500 [Phycisphaerae bacterium]|nr:hypothetical protein [Phycisphaerae bacterium]
MLNRKAFLLTGIVCLVISGLVLAYDVPNPNLNNDDIVDFADFAMLANN